MKTHISAIRHELKIARRLNNEWRSGVLAACLINIEEYLKEIEENERETI